MTEAFYPLLEIGDIRVKLIQGGMGVGISQDSLASAVANEGGAGIIASVELGTLRRYPGNSIAANKQALRDVIRSARAKTSGVIGVNIMHALVDYAGLVDTAIEEDVDMIISGAGIPRDLPRYLRKDSRTKLLPIVSSARLADMICKAWSKYNHLPDAIVVEGPKAGGHLGYSAEQLADDDFVEHGLERMIPEIVAAVRPYEAKAGRKIPVIAAGGIFYGGDIKTFLDLGASGVQMATRFVTTFECDANVKFKQAYVDCKKEDIVIIESPVGMPGRALKNKFIEEVTAGKRVPVNCPYHCLKPCVPSESPYCIARALLDANLGIFEDGYAFVGSNGYLCKEIVSVKTVFEHLNQEYVEGKVSSLT